MKTTPEQKWLLQAVKYFRAMEFFTEQSALSDEELASYLEKRRMKKSGRPFDTEGFSSDLVLLAYDENRVWWQDTEADVMQGNTVYVKTLREWSRISRGKFVCENIQETWKGEEGPIKVTFDFKGGQVALQPEFCFDWLDMNLLLKINRLISRTGMQFASPDTGDQTSFIVMLTTKEKAKLQVERGWEFESLSR